MTSTAKIFANITEAKRRMRIAAAAGVDLDTAGEYARAHGLAAIHRAAQEMCEDAAWWTDKDWHDDPHYESVEIEVGRWVQMRMLARPTEDLALAHIARQADRLTHADGPTPDVWSDVVITHIDLIKHKKHPDVIAMWRDVWPPRPREKPASSASATAGDATMKEMSVRIDGASPAARDRAWGRPPLWLKDSRRDTWYKNPEWTERVTSLTGRMRAQLDMRKETVE